MFIARLQMTSNKTELETKASSHAGQCIPAEYCHAHMLLYASGVNYNVNNNYTAEFLRFGIFPPQISNFCGATYRRNCNMFSALQRIYRPLADVENRVKIHS